MDLLGYNAKENKHTVQRWLNPRSINNRTLCPCQDRGRGGKPPGDKTETGAEGEEGSVTTRVELQGCEVNREVPTKEGLGQTSEAHVHVSRNTECRGRRSVKMRLRPN